MATKHNNLVYIGFNSRVAALDKNTGEIRWDWRARKGSGYVSLLLIDDDQLIVSVIGYTYCLNALTGEEKWFNALSGFGSGVASIVALNKHNAHDVLVAAASADADAKSSTSSSPVIE